MLSFEAKYLCVKGSPFNIYNEYVEDIIVSFHHIYWNKSPQLYLELYARLIYTYRTVELVFERNRKCVTYKNLIWGSVVDGRFQPEGCPC